MKKAKRSSGTNLSSPDPGSGREGLLPALSRKTFFLLLGALTLTGFLLRLLISFQLRSNDPMVSTPPAITDMATYIRLADDILAGKLPETFYYQPFYYSIFLPAARFFGRELGLIFFQSLLGAGLIFLAGKNALLLGGKKWGALAAGALTAFSSILLYFTPYALLELLQAFLLLFTFDLFFTAWRKHSLRHYLFAGLTWGASILTRGNTLLFLPLFLGLLLIREGDGRNFFRKKAFYMAALLLLGGMLLIQLPYIAYNSCKLGRLSGPSTAGPAVLALGNNKEAAPGGLELPYPPSYHALMRLEKAPHGVVGGILSWAKEEPLAFLEHKIKQFLLFWDGTEFPNNISEEVNAAQSPLMAFLRFLPTSFLLLLALAGFFQALRSRKLFRKKGLFLLWGMILLYAFSVAIFYILARFRLPVLPLAAVAGGGYLSGSCRKMGKRDLWHNFLFLFAGVFFVFILYPLYLFTYEPLIIKHVRPYGVRNTILFRDVPGLEKWEENAKDHPCEMVLDSSSILLSSWRAMPLKNGITIIKTFHAAPGKPLPAGEKGILTFPVVTTMPSSFLLEYEGGSQLCTPGAMENIVVSGLPLTRKKLADGREEVRIQLRFTAITGDPAIFLDSARDYERTLLSSEGEPPAKTAMEFVARLLLPH